MTKSTVWFINLDVKLNQESLTGKLRRMLKESEFKALGFEHRFAALKIHFGEPGNLAYLRPNFAKAVADLIKELGGRPFLTDCNTLYAGRRKNAIDHLEAAWENGYSPFSAGCPILIGDGLKGTDDVVVPAAGGILREARIGRAIMDADIFISLNHFKMHECTGVGGAVKNIGMGCGSRAGKMAMHAEGKPVIKESACIGCGACAKVCDHDAPKLSGEKNRRKIDPVSCVGCGRCIGACPVDAVTPVYDASFDDLGKKIAEYALAVVSGRPQFHISFVMDVVPFCDCHSENGPAVVPNIGIFASTDSVALDVACAEAVNKQPALPGGPMDGKKTSGDYFHDIHPTTRWRAGLEYAAKIGLGQMEYEIVEFH